MSLKLDLLTRDNPLCETFISVGKLSPPLLGIQTFYFLSGLAVKIDRLFGIYTIPVYSFSIKPLADMANISGLVSSALCGFLSLSFFSGTLSLLHFHYLFPVSHF